MKEHDTLDFLDAPSRPDGAPSDLELDRLDAGELSEAEASRIRQAINEQSSSTETIAQRSAEALRFKELLPRDTFIEQVSKRVEAQSAAEAAAPSKAPATGFWQRLGLMLRQPPMILGLAALAAAIIVLPRIIEPGKGFRDKGGLGQDGAAVQVLRLEGSAVRRIADGAVAHEGDRIQFVVNPDGRDFVMVVNVDDQGLFSPYFPDTEGESLPVKGDEKALLPWAIDLDGFIGKERIAVLLSDEPLTVAEVEDAVEEWTEAQPARRPLPIGRLSIPEVLDPNGEIEGLIQVNFDLVKE